jgi:hypothetical protein
MIQALLLLWTVSGWTAPAGSAWEEAAKSYDAGDYQRAIALYREIADAEPDAAAVHYNLGNALLRAGQLGRAIARYERAFDLAPRDADIRYNLAFALRRAGEDLAPSGVPPAIFLAFHGLSLEELAGLHWILAWATLLASSLWLLREGWRDRLGASCLALAALWAAAGGWWLAREAAMPGEKGVIVAPTAEIRSGPGLNFPVNVTAPEGRRVEVLSESGEWLEIGVTKEGIKGWVTSMSVERVRQRTPQND